MCVQVGHNLCISLGKSPHVPGGILCLCHTVYGQGGQYYNMYQPIIPYGVGKPPQVIMCLIEDANRCG